MNEGKLISTIHNQYSLQFFTSTVQFRTEKYDIKQ
jgi:hypothetical protein